MKFRFVFLMLFVLLAATGQVRPTLTHAQAQPDWLVAINALRTAAGLTAVTQNMDTTVGATRHSLYVVRNNFSTNIGVNPHIEDPNLPGFTPDGAQAGAAGDMSYQFAGGQPPSFADALAAWMTGAYHWEGFLNPGLTAVGYGTATYQDAFPNQPVPTDNVVTSAQTLVFIRVSAPRTQTIIWPPNRGTMPYTTNNAGETPDPLANCPGYATPTGASLSLQLPAAPNVTAASLTGAAGALDVCWFTNATVKFAPADQAWSDIGRAILVGANAVVIVPKLPLTPGSYCASVTNNGTPITWSFQVGAGGGPPPAPCAANG